MSTAIHWISTTSRLDRSHERAGRGSTRLAGYEVYRFGGYELSDNSASAIDDFFKRHFRRHRFLESS